MYRLAAIDPTTPPARLLRLARLAGVCPDGDDWGEADVGPGAALLVWLDAMLRARRPADADRLDLLLEVYAADVARAGEEAEAGADRQALLVLVDGTFAVVSGRDGCLDLRSGRQRKRMPQPPIESVTYNLTALYRFHRGRVLSAEKTHA